MNYFTIPVSPIPQAFQIALGGVTYHLEFQYRQGGGGWVLDIGDVSGRPIVCGIPVVTGVDLLGQYGYLGFKGSIWIQGGGSPDDPPTFHNLGTEARVFWVSD